MSRAENIGGSEQGWSGEVLEAALDSADKWPQTYIGIGPAAALVFLSGKSFDLDQLLLPRLTRSQIENFATRMDTAHAEHDISTRTNLSVESGGAGTFGWNKVNISAATFASRAIVAMAYAWNLVCPPESRIDIGELAQYHPFQPSQAELVRQAMAPCMTVLHGVEGERYSREMSKILSVALEGLQADGPGPDSESFIAMQKPDSPENSSFAQAREDIRRRVVDHMRKQIPNLKINDNFGVHLRDKPTFAQ